MKNILFICTLLLLGSQLSSAQSVYQFTFEDAVPEQWKASQGTFSLSDEHFMEGSKSLCWETTGNESVFTVAFTAFTSGSFATFFNLYNLKPTNNVLKVEYLDDTNVVRKTANVSLNFKGWRDFNRTYGKDFKSKLSVKIASVRFTLLNNTAEPQKIYFDNANFKASNDVSRQITDLMILDVNDLEAARAVLLTTFANPVDMESVDPTPKELEDYNKIKAEYVRKPVVATANELRVARNYINSLNITRNPDGTVKGNVMPASSSDLSKEFMIDITAKLEDIASSTKEEDKTLFNDFLDYIIDQGFFYKFPRLTYSDYGTVRTLPAQLMNILPVCSDEQRTEVLKMSYWMIEFGLAYSNRDYYSRNLSSDYVYLYFPYLYAYAAYQLEPKDGVKTMKALTRFIERTLEYNPGGNDILKVDGTGFHHNTHFNNYMYAYNGWMSAVYKLKGTEFRLSLQAYERLRKAVLSLYIMGNRASDGNYYANSLSGRHPITGGNKNTFSKSLFEQLVEIGGDIQGKEIDEELASAYNYFFVSDKYTAPVVDYKGYYQFNYSPIGVYRQGDWVATMRAPTTKLWGAEIYNATNRFGRYQSHGSLEIVYDGDLKKSGLPAEAQGWDWNVVPGTTTVHYTSWKEMMPGKNVSQRFDQYAKTKDFAGALAWGDCGVFASDFDQDDKWGNQQFTPTNLEFKKSVYAFDGLLISMGSNISSSGSYSNDMITATNLFQEVKSEESGDLNINGQVMSAGSASVTNNSDEDFWVVTPQGTGYFIPKGNDKIVLKYEEQEGPHETGKDVDNPAKATAAKAYIEHGVKPSDKKYLFVVAPSTTSEKMQELSLKLANNGGQIFNIESWTQNLHALTYQPEGITAYSFFAPATDLSFGVVKEVTSEMLLMQKTLEDTQLAFAVANPDLRPMSIGSYWSASSTETTITIKGEWYLSAPAENLTVDAPSNNETKIHLELNDGLPVYFNLKPAGYSSVKTEKKEDWVKVYTNSTLNETVVELETATDEKTFIELLSLAGIKQQEAIIEPGMQKIVLKGNQAGTHSMQVVRVTSGNKNRSLKVVW